MSAAPIDAANKFKDDYRLPTNARPTHYDITLRTDLEKHTFSGFASIDLDILKETHSLTFNAVEGLALQKCSLVSQALKTEQSIEPTSQTNADSKVERVTVTFGQALPEGSKATLQVGFEGTLGDSMLGYYRSSAEHEGQKRHYALTQFEATHARNAFPCWDEPLLKATYTVNMISRSDTVNLSNMPATAEYTHKVGDEQDANTGVGKLVKLFPAQFTGDGHTGKWKVTKFEKTPPMSTYLVAFANGHFEYLESSYTSPLSNKTRPLRIYATKDIIHQAQFALDVKAKVLPIYEKVFDVEYPLPKLDTLVASDFDAGAMENWGLITGRTSVFLFDEKKSDLAAKKRVATVQSHECAHMWFGDIVTMSWWDNLWLNEGFATLMGEVIIIDKVFPEWKVNSEFITQHLERALNLDARRSSHPIEVDCPDASQIHQIFDALSYSKAGSMLRMLANFVGEEAFLKGVSIYLKKRLFGNSVTRDLWDGIGEATDLDIAKIMENWTLKIGFPVITVKEVDGGVHLRQDRYLVSGDVTDAENQTIWHIPLSILSTDAHGKASIDRKAVLDKREETFKIDTSKPFKLNANTVGVYRVAYSPERLTALGKEAASPNSSFTVEDRMGLVSDAMVLAKSGHAKTSGALNLIKALKNEQEWLVWSAINSHVSSLSRVWWEQSEAVQKNIDAFRRSLFAPLVEKLGFEYGAEDSTDVRELRTLAVTQAAEAGDPTVLAELQKRFAHFQETGNEDGIPADLQRIAFKIAVRHGGAKEYNTVKGVFNKPPTPNAKIAALLAITSTRDASLIKDTFELLLKDVQLQDWPYIFAGMSMNPQGRREVAKFCMDQYPEISKRFEGNFSISSIIKFSFESLTSEKDAKELEAFFEGKDVSKFSMALAQSLDVIRANHTWLERSKEDVAQWFENWAKENSSNKL